MQKNKMGSVEILGYVGILLWLGVIVLREMNLSAGPAYQFLLGVLPNVGAAWVVPCLANGWPF